MSLPLPSSYRLLRYHDAALADPTWRNASPSHEEDPLWRWIERNHRHNALLWAEEDEARRRDVPDAAIAANKRNIDRFNQARNDAVEALDEVLITAIGERMNPLARLATETAGAIIDRLSILALKVRAMGIETARADAAEDQRAACAEKLTRLKAQRAALADGLDRLLAECLTGQAQFRVYRQFKMYNDPALNPALYRAAQ